MVLLNRLFAVYMVGLAVALAVYFIVSEFPGLGSGHVWNVFNWFMALGIIVSLAANYLRKRNVDGDGGGVTREYVEANLLFYLSALLFILFASNWLDDLMSGGERQSDRRLLIWMLLNPSIALIAGVTGCHLWRRASRR